MAETGDKRVSREELLAVSDGSCCNVKAMTNAQEMITPRFEGYYDMSLALDRLYEVRVQDNMPGYREFANLSPMLVIRDMALSADQEAERLTEQHKKKTDDLAGLLDYCIRVHLHTASATLKFLDGLGFAQDPKIKGLRAMLINSQRALTDNHKACVDAGILNKENTKNNVVGKSFAKGA